MRRIKGKRYLYFILLILTVALTACTSTSSPPSPPSPDFKLYEGNSLRIAVVGEPPKVKEKQVRFTEISFDEMTSEELKSYDAVFITENNLFEAAEKNYADVYLNSTIPFFFIGTYNFVPFTERDLEYDKSWNWATGDSYAVGVLVSQEDDTLKHWGYGLYNEEKTDENIEDVYSRIFKTIDELNH
ncbi:hypothetical protein KDN24_20815 [Bacillus sp. Bva_UNVM-123]|uniref:hypothetical protein n=1 Tax=Bacillus sp. Bva_UNVM-123 TaxID=2829798 RepID=UPI00391F2F94